MARLTVLGQSGTGKSWATGALIERALDPRHPLNNGDTFDLAVHFDAEDEEIGLSDADHDPLFRRLDVDRELAERIDWPRVIWRYGQVRVVPDMNKGETRHLYGVICGAVFRIVKDLKPDATAFVSCDEAGQFVKQNNHHPDVLELQTRGRKHGAETAHASQRPQQMHTTLISESDRRFYFRINDDNAKGKIQRQAGFNVENIPVLDGRRGLADLEDREVVIENNSTGEIVVERTDNWNRKRPHYADDDGIIDGVLPV